MSESDPDRPVVLATMPNEVLAQMLVDELEREEIKAMVSGGIASGFRAEAPGGARVLVRERDLASARGVLERWQAEARGDEEGPQGE